MKKLFFLLGLFFAGVVQCSPGQELNDLLHSMDFQECFTRARGNGAISDTIKQELDGFFSKVEQIVSQADVLLADVEGYGSAVKKVSDVCKNIHDIIDKIQHENQEYVVLQIKRAVCDLKLYAFENHIDAYDFQTSGLSQTVLKNYPGEKGFRLLHDITKRKESIGALLEKVSLFKALDDETQQAIRAYGLQCSKRKKGRTSSTPSVDPSKTNEKIEGYILQGHDNLSELSCAVQEGKKTQCLGLNVILRIPKKPKKNASLVDVIRGYMKVAREDDECIEIGQEFDVLTDTDIIECKHIQGHVSKYIPHLTRQALIASHVQRFFHSARCESPVEEKRAVELLQGKNIVCRISYKEPGSTLAVTRWEQREKRQACESRLHQHFFNTDDGSTVTWPIDLSGDTPFKNFFEAKERLLKMHNRDVVLKFIAPEQENRQKLYDMLLDLGGIYAENKPDRAAKHRRTSSDSAYKHSARKKTEDSGRLVGSRPDTPRTPTEVFREPLRVSRIEHVSPGSQSQDGAVSKDGRVASPGALKEFSDCVPELVAKPKPVRPKVSKR